MRERKRSLIDDSKQSTKVKKRRTSNNTKTRKKRQQKSKFQKKYGKIITVIFDSVFLLLIVVMLCGSFIFSVSDKQDKKFFGYRVYSVLTNSMKKTESSQKGNFSAGDMVIVKVEDPNKIEVGDIITFIPNKKALDTYLTHRVIKKEAPKADMTEDKNGKLTEVKNSPAFVTKGDANNLEDPPIAGNLVIGVVKFTIPKAGTIIKFVKSNLVAVLVFVSAFFMLIIIVRQYFSPDEEEISKNYSKSYKRSKRIK